MRLNPLVVSGVGQEKKTASCDLLAEHMELGPSERQLQHVTTKELCFAMLFDPLFQEGPFPKPKA